MTTYERNPHVQRQDAADRFGEGRAIPDGQVLLAVLRDEARSLPDPSRHRQVPSRRVNHQVVKLGTRQGFWVSHFFAGKTWAVMNPYERIIMNKYLYIYMLLIAGYVLAGQIGMTIAALLIVCVMALIPSPFK